MTGRLFVASGIFHPEAGGPATYLYNLLPDLLARGWDVRALAYGDAPTDGYPYPLTRIPRRALPLRLLGYARAARPLLDWASLVYLHTLGLPLPGERRAPRVYKIVGDQAWERAVRRRWIPPTEDIDAFQLKRYNLPTTVAQDARTRELWRADAVIVPSLYLRQMVAGWGVQTRRIHVIYNALPPQASGESVRAVSQAEARAQLDLPGDVPLLLTAARLTAWKGIDHVIATLPAAPEAHLLVAGDGPERGALERLAADTGVAERVSFLGQVARDRLALTMRAADYVVLYSGYEGLSHTLLESLHAGTPVIASDKGGNPEIVQHGLNGLLVPYIDRDALRETLASAFAPGIRERLAAGVDDGLERFSYPTMLDTTDAILRRYLPG